MLRHELSGGDDSPDGDAALAPLAPRLCVSLPIPVAPSAHATHYALASLSWPPLHIAAKHGDVLFVRALLEAGADVHMRAPDGKTALNVAQDWGWLEVVKELFFFGAE
jgi:hypothetical protein